MDELVKIFHIDWKLMVAQIVNFVIVLTVLWKFAMKPLQKVMDKRSEDIAKSLKNAKEIEKKLAETDKIKENTIISAKKEAQEIIIKAEKVGEEKRLAILEKTKQEATEIVVGAKRQINAEKEKATAKVREETADLVILSLKKILAKAADRVVNENAIKESIKNLK